MNPNDQNNDPNQFPQQPQPQQPYPPAPQQPMQPVAPPQPGQPLAQQPMPPAPGQPMLPPQQPAPGVQPGFPAPGQQTLQPQQPMQPLPPMPQQSQPQPLTQMPLMPSQDSNAPQTTNAPSDVMGSGQMPDPGQAFDGATGGSNGAPPAPEDFDPSKSPTEQLGRSDQRDIGIHNLPDDHHDAKRITRLPFKAMGGPMPLIVLGAVVAVFIIVILLYVFTAK